MYEMYEEFTKSITVQESSSSLLLMNVEDILGYAQLKAGKFNKIIKRFNIRRLIDDTINIQRYQADSKNIKFVTKFIGFPPKEAVREKYSQAAHQGNIPEADQALNIESDEKRIKQVLMNLQSNELKFTREGGTITFIAEYIRKAHSVQQTAESSKTRSEYIYKEDFSSSEEESVTNSDIS